MEGSANAWSRGEGGWLCCGFERVLDTGDISLIPNPQNPQYSGWKAAGKKIRPWPPFSSEHFHSTKVGVANC